MITVKNLHKSFRGTDVLKGINETIHKGEKVVVIGPSGSGKSTFLRCLNLLETPTEGEVWVEGNNITAPKTDIDKVRQKMGMVFQHFNLFPHLTVKKNITLAPITLKLQTEEEASENAMRLLKRIGLEEKADSYPNQLSGGQKQRISLARALAIRPSVLILDDTTSAVDMETEKQIQQSLRELDFPCTKIVIAQRISTTKTADKIIVLQNGYIEEMGTHEELMEKKGYYYELVKLQTGVDEL